MNMLTKQLLSLGLSVVTVAGMVSPVFAEDDVNVINTQDETTQTETATKKRIVLNIYKDGYYSVLDFEIDQNANNEEISNYILKNYVPKGYRVDVINGSMSLYPNTDTEWTINVVKDVINTFTVKIVYEGEPEKNTVETFDLDNNDAYNYIKNHYVPEGYSYDSMHGIANEGDSNHYILTIFKAKKIKLSVYYDSSTTYTPTIDVPSHYTDEEIKSFIEERYTTNSNYTITKVGEDTWEVRLTAPEQDVEKNEDFVFYINKDGVETSQKMHISKEDIDSVGGLYQYIKINLVPDGYHLNYNKGSMYRGLYSFGTNSHRIYLVKNSANPVMKKYTVKILKAGNEFNDMLAGAQVEYHTFEYDSNDTTGIEDYIIKKFNPKGYYIGNGPASFDIFKIDESTYGAIAFEMINSDSSTEAPKINSYKIDFIDKDTNRMVGRAYEYSEGNKLDKLDTSKIGEIPKGYVFAADSYDVGESIENNIYTVKVYVKKGVIKTPMTIKCYKNNNGKLEVFKTVNGIAQDYDKNGDYILDKEELDALNVKGYKYSGLSYSQNTLYYANGDNVCTSIETSFYFEEVATVTKPSSSKDSANLSDVGANETLAGSLNAAQQKKYDTAVKEGKEIEFKPIVKDTIKSEDKTTLVGYADKNDIKVVNAFDIEINLYVDNQFEGTISETVNKLTFKVNIPEELKKEGRKFYVLRLHDGKVTTLEVAEDGTFKTDQFSSYMLVYKDAVSTTPETGTKPGTGSTTTTPETGTKPGTESTTKPATQTKKDPVAKKNPKKNKTVNTGVQTAGTVFTGLMAASVAALGVAEVLKRRNK